MRKETKIGIFAVVTIGLAIWGFNYLKGFDLLASNLKITAVYNTVPGIRISTPVKINGLQVGLVADLKQLDKDLSQIQVEMVIDSDIRIPKDATAEIVSSSVMGGSEIQIVFSGPCEGETCVQDGGELKGVTKGLLASMATPEEVSVYVQELNKGLHSVLDTLNQRLADSAEINESVRDVRVILTNLKSTTSRLDRMMAGPMGRSLENVETITANLKANNDKINGILANAEVLTNDLKNADVSGLSTEAKATMEKLQTTLASSDEAVKNLNSILKNLNEGGEGAIAMLLHDKAFADKLSLTVKDLDLLLQDIRLHPERYRRILSKKKMPYEAPVDDPGRN
jgi:phospholipid/cholesterol/gamma-HCH transport system substrate-binding protein